LTPYPAINSPDPYFQTITYDAFNHSNRTGKLYTGELSDIGAYVNNRRQDSRWEYDADGNATSDASYQQTIDASSAIIHSVAKAMVGDGVQYPQQPRLDITQTYDGAGASAKRIQIARTLDLDDVPREDTQTTYYIKSSVLGGATVAEIGGGDTIHIYANGQRIARDVENNVTFEHHNPVIGSWVTSHGHSSYRTTAREERDPASAEIPLSDPYSYADSYAELNPGRPLFIEGSDPFDYSGGCTSFGMPISCGDAARYIEMGLGIINNIGFRRTNPRGPQGFAGFAITDLVEIWLREAYKDGYRFPDSLMAVRMPYVSPQNPTNKGTPMTDAEIADHRSAVAELLNDKTCKSFVEGVLSQIGDSQRKAFNGDLLRIFDKVTELKGWGWRDAAAMNYDLGEGGSYVGNTSQTAYINISTKHKMYGDSSSTGWVGRTVIHELLHVGGNAGSFSHWDMFTAGYSVAQSLNLKLGPRKPTEKDPGGRDPYNSLGFDDLLFEACQIRNVRGAR
jgi:hypothetical protein